FHPGRIGGRVAGHAVRHGRPWYVAEAGADHLQAGRGQTRASAPGDPPAQAGRGEGGHDVPVRDVLVQVDVDHRATDGASRRGPYRSRTLSTKMRRLRAAGKKEKAWVGLSKSQCG